MQELPDGFNFPKVVFLASAIKHLLIGVDLKVTFCQSKGSQQ